MTIVANGFLSRVYIEIDDIDLDTPQKHIEKIVLRLGYEDWFELTGIIVNDHDGFRIPQPIGCNCSITDISGKGWGNASFEIEYASGYGREGVFWARSFQRLPQPPSL